MCMRSFFHAQAHLTHPHTSRAHPTVPQTLWFSPALPAWLRWQDGVLTGVPTPDSTTPAQVEVCATYGNAGCILIKTFWVRVLAPGGVR